MTREQVTSVTGLEEQAACLLRHSVQTGYHFIFPNKGLNLHHLIRRISSPTSSGGGLPLLGCLGS